jgi:hypothetical protein
VFPVEDPVVRVLRGDPVVRVLRGDRVAGQPERLSGATAVSRQLRAVNMCTSALSVVGIPGVRANSTYPLDL